MSEFLVRNETSVGWTNKVTRENYDKIIQIKKRIDSDKGYSILEIQDIIPNIKNLELFLIE